MKIKTTILAAALGLLAAAPAAADDNTPKAGDVTVAATLGYNSSLQVTPPDGTLGNYELAASSTSWVEKKLTVGFEFGWFVADLWKISAGAGFNWNGNPGYGGKPGTFDQNSGSGLDNIGEIPNYRAVASGTSLTYNVSLGLDRYFKTGVENLMWYTGLRVGTNYAQAWKKFNEPESMGKSRAEAWSIKAGFIFGVDYFVLPQMFVGASVAPITYTYNMITVKPQEGLSNLSADTHGVSLVAEPTLRIGFVF